MSHNSVHKDKMWIFVAKKFFSISKKKYQLFKIFDEKYCRSITQAKFWTVFGQDGKNYKKNAWNIFIALTSPI